MVRQSAWSQSIQQAVGCTIVPERNLGCQAISSRAIGSHEPPSWKMIKIRRPSVLHWSSMETGNRLKGSFPKSMICLPFRLALSNLSICFRCNMHGSISPFQTTWLCISFHHVSPQSTQCYSPRSWPVFAKHSTSRSGQRYAASKGHFHTTPNKQVYMIVYDLKSKWHIFYHLRTAEKQKLCSESETHWKMAGWDLAPWRSKSGKVQTRIEYNLCQWAQWAGRCRKVVWSFWAQQPENPSSLRHKKTRIWSIWYKSTSHPHHRDNLRQIQGWKFITILNVLRDRFPTPKRCKEEWQQSNTNADLVKGRPTWHRKHQRKLPNTTKDTFYDCPTTLRPKKTPGG